VFWKQTKPFVVQPHESKKSAFVVPRYSDSIQQ